MNKSNNIDNAICKKPKFMSQSMWFVFLLRGDIRGNLPVNNTKAQREFVAWWLCFGRKEYPAVWSCDRNHISIAMEEVTIKKTATLPRLLWYIYNFDDIKNNFSLEDEDGLGRFLSWYRIVGPTILDFCPQLSPELLKKTEENCNFQPWSDMGFHVPCIAAALIEFGGQEVQEFFGFGHASRDIFEEFCLRGGWRRFIPPSSCLTPDVIHTSLAAPNISSRSRQELDNISVNLVGFARGELGVGEDVRMVSLALDSVNIKYTIIDVSEILTSARKNDRFKPRNSSETPIYPITIYCMPPFDLASVYLKFGEEFFQRQYKIGYFPWELPEFPDLWSDIYNFIDEIWAPSAFTAGAFENKTQKPVHVMPPAVALPEIALHSKKEFLKEVEEQFVFIYPFDPNSYLSRKNPLALIRAFRKAFDKKDKGVALLLRVNGDPRSHPGWKYVEDAASADSRIHIWCDTLDRADALGILGACDCLVSPHRSEGFGRNIAEAILLGLPVLATGFSGNADFMEPGELIAWAPRKLEPGEYPFGDGLWWAEPDVDDMARKMRSVYQKNLNSKRQSPAPMSRRRRFEGRHAPLSVGRRYAMRLQDILSRTF